mmetsp:Transcript_11134/g.68573  ORF Transcript_11134/g.68573 Transcript_11134/m.68573 type:complete len:114 (-) Transcript_11134:281-622(-)
MYADPVQCCVWVHCTQLKTFSLSLNGSYSLRYWSSDTYGLFVLHICLLYFPFVPVWYDALFRAGFMCFALLRSGPAKPTHSQYHKCQIQTTEFCKCDCPSLSSQRASSIPDPR